MKYKKAMIASCIFFSLLLAIYIIHIKYFRVNVVFYGAILDSLLATLVTTVVLFKSRIFICFNGFEKFQLVVIWALVGYALAIFVLTVIDRSLSFYILKKYQQRGGGIKLSGFEDVFTKEHVKKHQLVAVRLTEQQSSGSHYSRRLCEAD